jgi:hypothetical protein
MDNPKNHPSNDPIDEDEELRRLWRHRDEAAEKSKRWWLSSKYLEGLVFLVVLISLLLLGIHRYGYVMGILGALVLTIWTTRMLDVACAKWGQGQKVEACSYAFFALLTLGVAVWHCLQ